MLALTQGEGDAALFDPWFEALVDNGVELELIRRDVDRSLLRDVTRALFSVFDARALAAMHRQKGPKRESVALRPDDEEEQAWVLLRALWAPGAAKRGAR